ncbi:MAG: FAD-dependent oxidoreductase [Acidobacteria bacterium]|nr:FAD-dependent oxidoreductase [Acidobacteriota bacterium]
MQRRDFLGGYSLMVLAGAPSGACPPARAENGGGSNAGSTSTDAHMGIVELDADVAVAGGGLAGVCAAIAAARNGARVVLVQDRSRLGGNSSSEVRMHVCGADASGGRPGWRESGLIEEFRLEDAVRNPQCRFELWDLLLYDKVRSEPRIRLLLDTAVCGAAVVDGRIEMALARSDRTERRYRIGARLFVDATGDSRLALEAGAQMRTGREARGEFNESLAPERMDPHTQGSSILFTSRLHGRPMPFAPPAWARKITRAQLRMRRPKSWEYGYWWIEWGGMGDAITDDAAIRHELLAIVLGVWDYIKNSGDCPESANWALDWIGMIPGKRDSRRITGDHILTQNDILRGDMEDAVAIGGWSMDDHPSGGFDDQSAKPAQQIMPPDTYSIPLRSLYSKNIANLLTAGRNISASHVAFSSARVMATCATIGQAAGTAAALCAAWNLTPRQLYQQRMEDLRQVLLRDDQTIKNRRNEDPLDLARSARIAVSSEKAGAPGTAVIDGCTRDIPGESAHHWEGRMTAEGCWIELCWPAPQRIGRVQITFDTGFQRVLTLSGEASVMKRVIRGTQPETVRDYTILVRNRESDPWREVARVEGNYQRLRRHAFTPTEVSAVRVRITATNGAPAARLFEIRCYA